MMVRTFGRCLVAIGSMVAVLIAIPAASADARDKELLDTLLENGAITKEQYDRLLDPDDRESAGKAEDGVEEAESVPAVEKAGDEAGTDEAGTEVARDPNSVNMRLGNRGLVVSTEDEKFSMTVSGRLHAEASFHVNDGDLPSDDKPSDGTEIRRARFMLAAKFYEDWKWTGEVDFADNEVAIKDFWMSYSGLPYTKLYAGHAKQPYSLTIEMSSNDIPFVERSVDNFLLAPFVDRAIGLRAEVTHGRFFLATGIYGENVEPNKDTDEGWGTVGRLVYVPILNDQFVVHLAGRAAYRQPNTRGNRIRIKDETTHMSDLTIVDTGEIENVHGVTLIGPEAAIAAGPVALVGEYTRAYFDRRGPDRDVDFDSWHVNFMWIISGETRQDSYRLNAAEFKRLAPKHNFQLRGGGWGAWEFATRIAGINLNDGPITGGRETVFTAGLNWYLNPVVRIMADWSRIVDTDGSNEVREAADGIDFFQFRTQVAF